MRFARGALCAVLALLLLAGCGEGVQSTGSAVVPTEPSPISARTAAPLPDPTSTPAGEIPPTPTPLEASKTLTSTAAAPAAAPSATPSPARQFTPTTLPTSTPAGTPTAVPPLALENTPVAVVAEPLSPDSAQRITALARLGKGTTANAAISPDGRRLAVASSLGVYIYDAQTLDLVTFYPTGVPVNKVRYAPDGQTFAWGLADGRVEIRVADSGDLVRALPSDSIPVHALAYSEDGARLTVAQDDLDDYQDGGTVSAWDLDTGEIIASQAVAYQEPFSLIQGGQTLALPDIYTANISFMNVLTGQQAGFMYAENSNYLYFMAVSPDGKALLVEDGGAVSLWHTQEPAAGVVLQDIPEYYADGPMFFAETCFYEADGPGVGNLESAAFSPDGKLFVLGARAGRVQIRRVSDGALLASFSGRAAAITFAPDGQTFTVLPGDGSIEMRQTRDGALLKRLTGHTNGFTSVDFSPDGRMLAAGASDDRVRLWDLNTGRRVLDLQSQANQVIFSPDGSTLAAGSLYGGVELWNLSSGEKRTLYRGRSGGSHLYRVNTLNFTADGGRLIAGSQACFLQVWDTQSGQLERVINNGGVDEYLGSRGAVVGSAALFSGDQKIATNYIDRVIFLDLAGEDPVEALPATGTSDIERLAFLPGETRLVVGNDWVFQVWNVNPPEMLYSVEAPSQNLVASPDGQLLAGTDQQGNIILRRAKGGEQLAVLRGHRDGINQLAFSRDGKFLASASRDGTVIIWGVEGPR